MAKTFNPGKFEQRVQGAATILTDPRSLAGNQYYGTISTASTTQVVSTYVVRSDSLIFLSARGTGPATAAFTVTSVVDQQCFTVTGSFITGSGSVIWEIKNRK